MQTGRLTKYLADRLSLPNQVLLQEFSRFIPTGKITIYGNSRSLSSYNYYLLEWRLSCSN